MDISTVASIASANASTTLKAEASVLVLKKAMELQTLNAAQLLQALPPAPSGPTPGATIGGAIDVFV
ncbi:YjfB family protein [Aromatoleum petrolei]|uniref:Motility protein n=1 Tax=Aromatoleum petrolei TaxID=76116 RepID=A0ABX1MRE6_9RHOO|nr:YjfB family protein [Aromatoleum petrolei]NMF88920.1 putative motility protein [Aromatoleum petrolei]QTQ37781.1 putative motility protein [Aromatoleum petrolei]